MTEGLFNSDEIDFVRKVAKAELVNRHLADVTNAVSQLQDALAKHGAGLVSLTIDRPILLFGSPMTFGGTKAFAGSVMGVEIWIESRS